MIDYHNCCHYYRWQKRLGREEKRDPLVNDVNDRLLLCEQRRYHWCLLKASFTFLSPWLLMTKSLHLSRLAETPVQCCAHLWGTNTRGTQTHFRNMDFSIPSNNRWDVVREGRVAERPQREMMGLTGKATARGTLKRWHWKRSSCGGTQTKSQQRLKSSRNNGVCVQRWQRKIETEKNEVKAFYC